MKKISVALDGLKLSSATLDYAISLAGKTQALLCGVFLDDFTYHSYKIYDMVGDEGLSTAKLHKAVEKDKETRKHSVQVFEQACDMANIKKAVHHDKSLAGQELLRETIYSDLVVININETFSHISEAPPTQFVKTLLADTQCPVLVTPESYNDIKKVIILYDGNPSSVFAIKMFNYLLPWMKDYETEVITVTDPQEAKGIPGSKLIKEFISCQCPGATYTVLHGNAEEKISHYLKTQQNALVVLGAYKRGAVSMWFKNSMADVLMKETKLPLFIAHNK
ncbi:universal stress protein [Mucilaginibacter hurinus]|uniref:Universal stress protein n=1 Tax=Mucilaginibacter hurinus TaxID=2201324 RepID=A0A367GPS0_9SPHI|nr:universal stress protein [Mucilaginibacter hurinus]RCH55454.1 universal stress protein [Mucilaginibacter hurinus]